MRKRLRNSVGVLIAFTPSQATTNTIKKRPTTASGLNRRCGRVTRTGACASEVKNEGLSWIRWARAAPTLNPFTGRSPTRFAPLRVFLARRSPRKGRPRVAATIVLRAEVAELVDAP